MANNDVTHDRSSWLSAPWSMGEVSDDSKIKKLEDVHPAASPYNILVKLTVTRNWNACLGVRSIGIYREKMAFYSTDNCCQQLILYTIVDRWLCDDAHFSVNQSKHIGHFKYERKRMTDGTIQRR